MVAWRRRGQASIAVRTASMSISSVNLQVDFASESKFLGV